MRNHHSRDCLLGLEERKQWVNERKWGKTISVYLHPVAVLEVLTEYIYRRETPEWDRVGNEVKVCRLDLAGNLNRVTSSRGCGPDSHQTAPELYSNIYNPTWIPRQLVSERPICRIARQRNISHRQLEVPPACVK